MSVTRGEVQQYLRDVALQYEGSDCLTWPYARFPSGYGKMGYRGKTVAAHLAVCLEAHGDRPTPTHQAAHSCGKGLDGCVAKRHLSWKTRKENEADKLIHGTLARGERHGNSKLTSAIVHEIRALRGTKTTAAIARQFGVAQSRVSRIHTGKSWCWLQPTPKQAAA